jgi:uncharacterized protein YecT (DUF1311 family)
MRFAVLIATFALAAAPVAQAQHQSQPAEVFAGQRWQDIPCEPQGSTLTMSACYALWRAHEEALLQQSFERLLAFAQEQEARLQVSRGERGYVASVTRGQVDWIAWRNSECELVTLDSVGGTIRQLTYPNCQAQLTAQRRERLEAVFAQWRAEFRDDNGEWLGTACALQPEAFPHCRERE